MDEHTDKSNLPDPQDDELSSQELNESDNEVGVPAQSNIDSKAGASNLEITENLSDNHYINSDSPQKKSKTPLILGLTFSVVLVILLASGLTYAASTNKISLPFMMVEVNAPIIAATTNADGSSTVTINNPNTTGTIYYTIDGSDPLTNSKKYESPITISTTTSLKARAIDEKDNLSDITNQQFTIVEKVVEKIVEAPVTAESVPTTTTYSNDTEIMESIAGKWTDGKNNTIYFESVNKVSHDCPIQFKDIRDGMTGTYGVMNVSGNILSIKIYNQKSGGITIDDTFAIDIGTQGDGIISIWGVPWTYISDAPIF